MYNLHLIDSENSLLDYVEEYAFDFDAIVVEGYDGVGKGRILNLLSQDLYVIPYRPDYNLWQKYELSRKDRWKISAYFWDIWSHFVTVSSVSSIMLFDRGVLSGAVYNNDPSIAETYKTILRDRGSKVLHIIVICESKEDYKSFAEVRGVEFSEEEWEKYQLYTGRFLEFSQIAEVPTIIYQNKFNTTLAEGLSRKCEGCGHYSYGWCRHPLKNCQVDGLSPRCEYSNDEEVQDTYDKEMQHV